MAKYAKLAGMVTGLAIGLGGGVLLAVMNPLIPDTDKTQVAGAPDAVQPAVTQQGDAPVLGGPQPEVKPAVVQGDKPVTSAADSAPAQVPAPQSMIKTGEDSPIAPLDIQSGETSAVTMPKANITGNATKNMTLDVPPNAGKVVVKPLRQALPKVQSDGVAIMVDPDMSNTEGDGVSLPNQPSGAAPSGAVQVLPAVSTQAAPDISTTPAKPLIIAEPNVDTANGSAQPLQPAANGGTEVITPGGANRAIPAPVPQKIETAPDVLAALPTIPEPKRRVNKSGTFATSSSRLPTTGGGSFVSRKSNDTGGKFPTIGTKSARLAPDAVPDPNAVAGALVRNAVAFAGADKPLMSIILIDIGDKGLPMETLQTLTIPAAFALPADQQDVGVLAQSYARAGFEVLALSPRAVEMSLSGGLDQAQVDEIIGQIFADMPQAIGLIDRTSADLQKDRKLAKSVVSSFRKSGHGLVTYAEGLNPVPRAAGEAGVAAGTVYRNLDGKGETAAVMLRYLDRAVLDARRNGQVIVLGTTAPETVATIVNWALSSKARGVALAPVSASLKASLQ